MRKVDIRAGDYVSTAGMTEEQYHAVARAFLKAGAEVGEYPNPAYAEDDMGEDWAVGNRDGAIWHGLYWCFTGRQLTVDQILGTTEPEWNGEGLPPVGTVCEMARPGENHAPGCLRYAGNDLIVWQYENGVEIAIRPEHGDFRPLRTEEDKAIDHMKSVAGTSYVKPEHMEMITRALYRAGYRKTGDTK